MSYSVSATYIEITDMKKKCFKKLRSVYQQSALSYQQSAVSFELSTISFEL
jgi:hypothetical protein